MKQFQRQTVLAIVVAMPEELDAVMTAVGQTKEISALGRTFHCRDNICVAQSGIGLVDAASATEALLWFVQQQGGEVAKILNVGVVGSLCPDINVCQPLLVEKAVHYDFDIRPARPNGRLGEYPDGQLFYETEISLLEACGERLQLATLASGDRFLADPEKQREITDEFDAHICDMEGVAVARVAVKHQIPLVMIKTVSDSGDHDEYEENLSPAMSNLHEVMEIIVKEWR